MGRHGSGAGGGKESLFQAPPVDLYRKRIGRQDSKKEKGHQKEIKHQHEAKEMAPVAYKQSFLILMSVMAVVVGIYALLFYLIGR